MVLLPASAQYLLSLTLAVFGDSERMVSRRVKIPHSTTTNARQKPQWSDTLISHRCNLPPPLNLVIRKKNEIWPQTHAKVTPPDRNALEAPDVRAA